MSWPTPASSAHPAGDFERARARNASKPSQKEAAPGTTRPDLEEERRHAEGEREVASRARGDVRVGQGRRPVADGVDEDEARTAGLRLLEERKEVDARDEGVLPPEEDPPGVPEVEDVVRFLVAEIGQLRRVAGSGADVASLDGDRPEELEEEVDDALHEAEGAPRAVVEDCRGPGFGANRQEALGGEREGVVPRDRAKSRVVAKERCREPVRRVLPLRELRGSRAEEALRDRVAGVAAEPHEPAVLDSGDQAAGVGAVAIAHGAQGLGRSCGASYGLCARRETGRMERGGASRDVHGDAR